MLKLTTMYRTRFAPSPTGSLHIAGIRNALYCFALAKKNNGSFIVRIEDTDQSRFVEGSIEEIFEMLELYGLNPDESIYHKGDYGPYIQSQRLDIYQKYIYQLLDSGNAYYCFLDQSELESLQKEFRGKGFRSPYRYSSKEVIAEKLARNLPYVVRLKVPENRLIRFNDGIQGEVVFDSNLVGDEILIKSNGFPSYHFAVVVDDYDMKISHVIRSIEWLPSTPKHILIHEFLKISMPLYFHPPVILDPKGGKLSKRKGTVSAKTFLEEGYLAEAVLNFVMLLGWAPPIKRSHGEKEREVFSLSEFVDLFDLRDINKSNAIFNREKLLWFNQEYIKKMPVGMLTEKFVEWVNKFAPEHPIATFIQRDREIEKKITLLQSRVSTFRELIEALEFFYKRPSEIDFDIPQLSEFKDRIDQIRVEIYKLIQSMDNDCKNWDNDFWVVKMKEISTKMGIKGGDSFMLLRVIIVGKPFSPPLFESLQILGKEGVLQRLKV